jgi:hypothetical protein
MAGNIILAPFASFTPATTLLPLTGFQTLSGVMNPLKRFKAILCEKLFTVPYFVLLFIVLWVKFEGKMCSEQFLKLNYIENPDLSIYIAH